MNKEYETYVEGLDWTDFQEALTIEVLEEIHAIIHNEGKIIGKSL